MMHTAPGAASSPRQDDSFPDASWAQRGDSDRGLGERAVTGAMWTSLAAGTELILHTVVVMVLARLLAPADFGIVALGFVIVGLNRVFAEVGLGPSLVQRKVLTSEHIATAFTLTLLLGVVCFAFVVLIAPAIASIFRNGALTGVVRALAVLFPLRAFVVVARSLLRRDLRFPEIARADVISYLLGYGFAGVGLAVAGAGYWALVAASIVQAVAQTVQLLRLQAHPMRLSVSRQAFNDLFSFGAGTTLGRLGNYIAVKGDNVVVARVLGLEALGVYSRAYDLMAIPVGLYQAVAIRVLFSAVAKIQDQRDRLAVAHRRAAALTGLLLIPPSLLGFALAPELVRVVLGPGWDFVIPPFRIMVLGMFFRSGYNVGAAVAKGSGDVHRLALRQWIYAAAVLMGAWLGHPYGIVGTAIGVLGAILAQFSMVTALSLRASSLGWREFGAAHVPAALAGLIVCGCAAGAASVLRGLGWPPLGILLGSCGCALGVVVAFAAIAPMTILGYDALWAFRIIVRNLPQGRMHPIAVSFVQIEKPVEPNGGRIKEVH